MKWWAGCLPSLVTLGLLKGEITHFNSISRDPVINKPHDLLGSDFLIPSHKACDKNISVHSCFSSWGNFVQLRIGEDQLLETRPGIAI